MSDTYRGRLAPSPTGLLHLGHAATFLVAYHRALAASGRLVLRVDDLDSQRFRPEFLEAMQEDLLWLGLRWETEFRQSRRLELYREAMRALLRKGCIFPCFCSRKDLAEAAGAPHEDGHDEPLYNGRCRPEGAITNANRASLTRFGAVLCASDNNPCEKREKGQKIADSDALDEFEPRSNYRFRVPEGEAVGFEDLNVGPQSFVAGRDFGDFLVWRKDGLPSYQLASVVDDAAMGITEVVRGRDLLRSTARQILLQRALGLPTPAYFHTELLRDARGERLAKRHDALSLRALRDTGVTPAEISIRVGPE